jgi:uncharacterized protein (DUF1786 family)
MRILAIDVGTGTQDILLFDSTRAVENSVQMVMPSPTVIARDRVAAATVARRPVVLTGVNMGGGPVTGAVERHVKARLPVYATPSAAVTFDDDLDEVRAMGVTILSEDEAAALRDVVAVELKDLDLDMVRRSLAAFDVAADWDALAVAVFDHGDAPPGYSDRKFRFDHLRRQVLGGKRDPASFVYLSDEVPDYLTRMRSVIDVASRDAPGTPILMTDTAVAAIMGSLEDSRVAAQPRKVVANLGNEHTLAFHLEGRTILGLYEHHTHVLKRDQLEDHLRGLVRGDLDDDEVWRGRGHGAIVIEPAHGESDRSEIEFLSVIGPMRGLLEGSALRPYFATPHGSMMLAGPFGLVRAWAERNPEWHDEIEAALRVVGEDMGHAH